MPVKTLENGDTIYTNDEGDTHRDDGPAIIHPSGAVSYYKNGQPHRLDGPALDFSKDANDGCTMYWVNGKQHRDGGPAEISPDGYLGYWLNDVQVTEEIACTPAEKLNPNLIFTTENVEIRREIVRKIGVEILVHKLGGKVLDKDGDYELLELKLGANLTAKALKMLNPSVPEIWHVEFVIPTCNTVQDALNFRNVLTADQIDDINGADWFQQGDVIVRPKDAKKFKSRPKDIT